MSRKYGRIARLLLPVALIPVAGAASLDAQAACVSLTDRFGSYTDGAVWQEGSEHGDWKVVYDGFGVVGIDTDGTKVLKERPKASTSWNETHAALVKSVPDFGNLDFTLRMKTVNQLRTPTPKKWERAWAVWHYKRTDPPEDSDRFYYFVLKDNGWELGKVTRPGLYEGNQKFLASGTTPTYPVGEWNEVRIRQVGSVISVWVDDIKVVDGLADSAQVQGESVYTSGKVGFYSEDAKVHFDDAIVTCL